MYIKHLKLVNIRSFSKAEIEFSKGINLLVGNNNSGKSTIIKALYKLQNLNALDIDDVRKTNEYGRIAIDLNKVSKEDAILFAIHHKGILIPDAKAIKVCFNIFANLFETKRGHENLYFDSSLPHKEDATGKIELLPVDGQAGSFTDFSGLPNMETYNNFIYPFFANRKTNYYSNQNLGDKEAFYVGENLRNITSKIQSISNRSHPKHEEFGRLISEILGFNIGVIPYRDNQSNTGLFVRNNVVIPIENMGEGVVNILGLIVLLLTEDNKLYLIEELENDIHPSALKKLLKLIVEKSTNNQFVISTHSNLVVKYLGVDSTKIFQLLWNPYEKNEKDQLPTTTIQEIENSPQAKLNLLESLGYDLFDFDLYKSYIIFEESSAERIVRDFLIPEFCPSLVNKVRTIAASGVDDLERRFHNFLTLFVYIHKTPVYYSKAWVFADGDNAGKSMIESLRQTFKSWPKNHFISFTKSDFEEFYPASFREKFSSINEIKNSKVRQQQKKDLTNEVLAWINKDKAKAKKEFEKSAKEVIRHLKKIETAIK